LSADVAVFPAWSEADWRKAAEAALSGGSVESLPSATAEGIRIEPLYAPAGGPGRSAHRSPYGVMARLDDADPREANAQALDDLAAGADGAVGGCGLSSREGRRAVRPRRLSAPSP
jgi:methylmalonyl-CoA mutase